jgi:glycosyltransferase involved in cell wall biosynthesis
MHRSVGDVRAERKKNTLIFTGSFKYHTNYDAMLWFVQDIFPLILNQLPDTQLIITGDHAGKSLPSEKNIKLTGYVDDIKSLIASCAVSIAPLLDGGGTRLKILEAMALGTPVVSTSKGAEGLDIANSEDILLADDPADFADWVIRLLRDEQLHDKLAKNAKTKAQKSYDWAEMYSTYDKLVKSVLK